MTKAPSNQSFEHVEGQDSVGSEGVATSFEDVEVVGEEVEYEDEEEGEAEVEESPHAEDDDAQAEEEQEQPEAEQQEAEQQEAEEEEEEEEHAEAEVAAVEEEQAKPASVEAEQAMPAAAPPAAGANARADTQMDLKQIEAQASKVAKDVQDAAVEMSNKLSAGFKSALGGLGTTESPSLSKLAGGLASWWSSLDPPSQPKRDETVEAIQASSKATSELQELFGLLPEENLVETFKCKLLQTYGCNHNSFTPAIQMAFQGTLYITDKHTCFTVEERNRKMPFKVLHTDITKAVRQRPVRKGDLSDILRLDLSPGSSAGQQQQFLALKDFDSGSALDSALALVEHLMEGP